MNSVTRSGSSRTARAASAVKEYVSNSRLGKSVKAAYRSVKDFMDPRKNDSALEARLRRTSLGRAITQRQKKKLIEKVMQDVPVSKRGNVATSVMGGRAKAQRSMGGAKPRVTGAARTAKQKVALERAQRISAARRRRKITTGK